MCYIISLFLKLQPLRNIPADSAQKLVWTDVPSIAFSYVLAIVCHYFIGVGVTTAIIKCVIDSNIIATGGSTVVTLLLWYTMLNRFVYKTNKIRYQADDNH
jgi:hypothetical protein